MRMRVCLLIIHAATAWRTAHRGAAPPQHHHQPAPAPSSTRHPRRTTMGNMHRRPTTQRSRRRRARCRRVLRGAPLPVRERRTRYIEKCAAPGGAGFCKLLNISAKSTHVLIGATKRQNSGQCRRDGQAEAHRGGGEFPGLFGRADGGEIAGRRHAGVRRGQSPSSRGRPRASWRAGLSDRVRFFVGLASDEIPRRRQNYRTGGPGLPRPLQVHAPDLGSAWRRRASWRRALLLLPTTSSSRRAGLPRQGRGAGLRHRPETGALRVVGWETRWK